MNDVYSVLAKHFAKETTVKEELSITAFKEQNPLEYEALKQLWNADVGHLEVINFDVERALDRVEHQVKRKEKTRVITLFSTFRKIAAVVALLIATVSIGYFTFNKVTENTVITVSNATVKGGKVLLADGSVVWLNENATLSYSKTFNNDRRIVTLSGEAFFEVSKDNARPFTVQMKTTDVTVLGTSFNIKEDSIETLVSVKTGKVRVRARKLDEFVDITPNQTAKVNTSTLQKFKTKNKNYLAWKTGEFEFDNTPINQVVSDLNTFYKTKLIVDNTMIFPDCHLTAKFSKSPIADIIETLKLTCTVDIVKEGDSYLITKK